MGRQPVISLTGACNIACQAMGAVYRLQAAAGKGIGRRWGLRGAGEGDAPAPGRFPPSPSLSPEGERGCASGHGRIRGSPEGGGCSRPIMRALSRPLQRPQRPLQELNVHVQGLKMVR
jgi:hypothetical protein